jgi:hypothetical protein
MRGMQIALPYFLVIAPYSGFACLRRVESDCYDDLKLTRLFLHERALDSVKSHEDQDMHVQQTLNPASTTLTYGSDGVIEIDSPFAPER